MKNIIYLLFLLSFTNLQSQSCDVKWKHVEDFQFVKHTLNEKYGTNIILAVDYLDAPTYLHH